MISTHLSVYRPQTRNRPQITSSTASPSASNRVISSSDVRPSAFPVSSPPIDPRICSRVISPSESGIRYSPASFSIASIWSAYSLLAATSSEVTSRVTGVKVPTALICAPFLIHSRLRYGSLEGVRVQIISASCTVVWTSAQT